jgi:hypothetical protein
MATEIAVDCVGDEPAPGWMIVSSCEDGKLWLEHQHSFAAYELDHARPREHAAEILEELGA